MGIDGFRLDAARYVIEEIVDENEAIQADSQGTLDFWVDYTSFVKSVNPDVLLVTETWAAMETVGTYWVDGKGVDSSFDFDFGYEVAEILNDVQRTADFGTVGEESDEVFGRMKLWKNLVDRNDHAPLLFYAPFLSNHDQERIMYALGNDFAKARIAASLVMTSPGSVYLYYGEEIGLTQATTGDDIYRRAIMQWEDEPDAGFNDTAEFWSDQGKWVPWMPNLNDWWKKFWKPQMEKGGFSVASQKADPDSLLNHYQKLISIRNEYPVLTDPEMLKFYPVEDENVWMLKYKSEEQSLVVVVNLNPTDSAKLDLTAWKSHKMKDLYSGEKVDLGKVMTLEPTETLILKKVN
jgi:alpha-amylase